MKKILAIFFCLCMLMPVIISFAASDTANQTFSTETLKDEVIFHYKDAVATGTWNESVAIKNYDGGAHIWSKNAGDSLVYTLKGIKAGNYEAFTWVLPHKFNLDKQEYTVKHNGKNSFVFAYQKLEETETVKPGWVSMGVLDFSGDGDETFTLVCPGNNNVRGSAIKLVPTTKDVSVSSFGTAEERSVPDAVYVSGKPEKVSVPHSDSQLKDIELDPTGVCTWEGNWAFSKSALGPMVYVPQSLWISAADTKDGTSYVMYNPDIMAIGDVNIFVYILWWKENQNENVKYEIHHNGKIDQVVLDPTALTESSWVNLGTFDFSGETEKEYVKLVPQDSTYEKANTRASTMMFEIVNTEGGIWQTRYVTPYQETENIYQSANLTPLDKFDDMVGHWANYDVEYMANEGLVSGVADNLFDPEANITRAEYLTILDRAMDYELISGESYPDVAQDAWYAPYIATAKANGLIAGLPTDDGFKPEQPITREEMALFTYNAIKATKKNDAWVATMQDVWGNFGDTAEVSDWAVEAMQYLIKTEIIRGTSDTTVSPKENATRAQGAVILKRFMQLFVWAGPPTNNEWVLMFNDEFSGNEMNWGVWRSDSSSPSHIQSSRWPENVQVHDGAVHLVVRREEKGGKHWTSASVWVRPEVFAQTYGYWEARYKIAAAPGINNAFWTYVPHNHNIHMNPDVTTHFELDINEGHYPNEMATCYHTWVTGERKQNSKAIKFQYDLSKDYHTYALEWTPEKLIFYFDGQIVREQENLNAHQLQFPYLSSAVLNWAGKINEEADNTAQIVDYVRIWQKKADAENPELNYRGEELTGAGPTDAVAPIVLKDSDGNEVSVKTVTLAEQKIDQNTYESEFIIEPELNENGNWRESSAIRNYNGGTHKWSATPGDRCLYTLNDVAQGEYKVYAWRLPYSNNNPQMDFILKQNGNHTYLGSVALKLSEGETAEPGWVEIGSVKVTTIKDAQIEYVCPGGNCRAMALKLVPVK